MVTPPRQFFESFVVRSRDEFRENPSDDYRATVAVHFANVMAERMWHHFQTADPVRVFNAQNAAAYRDLIAQSECSEFGIVRDVDDSLKHVFLSRKLRRVTSANQTGAVPIDWTNSFGGKLTWTNTSRDEIEWLGPVMVQLDNGTGRPLMPMLDDVVRMWDRLSR